MRQKLEYHLQQEIVLWFNRNYPKYIIFAVHNEAGYRNKSITGVLKGVSDLVVVLHQKVVFVELKTEKGVQSKFQKLFERRINKTGHEYYICRSLDEFKEIICNTIHK